MAWFPKNKVLVPVDLSDFSLEALRVAREIVDNASGLHIMHILSEMSPVDPAVLWGEVDDRSRVAHAEKTIREKIGPDFDAAHVEIQIGNPPMRIARYAQQAGIDLIVIHSHGRTGPAHLLLGSVTERVVRHAHCPVLVIRD